MKNNLIFSDRIIYDHIPKTAGTSVHKWLMDTFGSGCVSSQVSGSHRELISKYGGTYSIICAHLFFEHDDTLDPRYKYITCLRNPIDRAISWLYYLLNDYKAQHHADLYHKVMQFIESSGEVLDESLYPSISNFYMNHFSNLTSPTAEVNNPVSQAIKVIDQYDVIGLQEDLPAFINNVANLLGCRAPAEIKKQRVNATRPTQEKIEPRLLEKLMNLNALDLEFYAALRQLLHQQPASHVRPIVNWKSYQGSSPLRNRTSDNLILGHAEVVNESTVFHGKMITFRVDLLLNKKYNEFIVEIQIFDSVALAFGVNSTTIKKTFTNLTPGSYQINFNLIANLPKGHYTAGFIFSEKVHGQIYEVARYNSLCQFDIVFPLNTQFAGYIWLPTDIEILATTLSTDATIVTDPFGFVSLDTPLETILPLADITLDVEIANHGTDSWKGDFFRPINLSYRWMDQDCKNVLIVGERTPLPSDEIRPGEVRKGNIKVKAPPTSGEYILIITLVQEHVCWFDNMGNHFKPYITPVTVLD
jgi:hypothetical protein